MRMIDVVQLEQPALLLEPATGIVLGLGRCISIRKIYRTSDYERSKFFRRERGR